MARSLALAVALMVVAGLAQSRLLTGVQQLLQAHAPERLRGRVMALFSQIMLGGLPLYDPLLAAMEELDAGVWPHPSGCPPRPAFPGTDDVRQAA